MVRLSRNPDRLQTRIKELDQELSTVDRKLSTAARRKSGLAAERQAILKALEGRVAAIALAYLTSDAERSAAFRKSLRGEEASTVGMYTELKQLGGAGGPGRKRGPRKNAAKKAGAKRGARKARAAAGEAAANA